MKYGKTGKNGDSFRVKWVTLLFWELKGNDGSIPKRGNRNRI